MVTYSFEKKTTKALRINDECTPPPHTHTHHTHTTNPQNTATDLLRNISKNTNGRHFDNKLKYRIRDALPKNGHTIAKMVIETISR